MNCSVAALRKSRCVISSPRCIGSGSGDASARATSDRSAEPIDADTRLLKAESSANASAWGGGGEGGVLGGKGWVEVWGVEGLLKGLLKGC